VARVEGRDARSFFAVAESDNGVDNFRFWDQPVALPEAKGAEANVSDMRLTVHEDGWVYGAFESARQGALAEDRAPRTGFVRTRDLVAWDRLDDVRSPSVSLTRVALHPELVKGQYAFYTCPSRQPPDAIGTGRTAFALCENIEQPELAEEKIVEARASFTLKELEFGVGPAPFKTAKGWLHLALAWRLRGGFLQTVLHPFLSDLEEPWRVIAAPSGYLLAREWDADVGGLSAGISCSGAVLRSTGEVFIYYAVSGSRIDVATTTVERLLDYVIQAPPDPPSAHASAAQRTALIERNLKLLARTKVKAYRGLR